MNTDLIQVLTDTTAANWGDAVQVRQSEFVQPTDSLTWVDTVSRAGDTSGITKSPTDDEAPNWSDGNTQLQLLYTLELADQLTWVDVEAVDQGLQFSVVDSLTWSDVAAYGLTGSGQPTDSLTWTDSLAVLQSEAVSLVDSLTWTDAEAYDTSQGGLTRVPSDVLTWTDSTTTQISGPYAPVDDAGQYWSDGNTQLQLLYTLELHENMGPYWSDAGTTFALQDTEPHENMGQYWLDSLQLLRADGQQVLDSAKDYWNDAGVDVQGEYLLTLDDSLTWTDALGLRGTIVAQPTDSLTWADAVVPTLGYQLSWDEGAFWINQWQDDWAQDFGIPKSAADFDRADITQGTAGTGQNGAGAGTVVVSSFSCPKRSLILATTALDPSNNVSSISWGGLSFISLSGNQAVSSKVVVWFAYTGVAIPVQDMTVTLQNSGPAAVVVQSFQGVQILDTNYPDFIENGTSDSVSPGNLTISNASDRALFVGCLASNVVTTFSPGSGYSQVGQVSASPHTAFMQVGDTQVSPPVNPTNVPWSWTPDTETTISGIALAPAARMLDDQEALAGGVLSVLDSLTWADSEAVALSGESGDLTRSPVDSLTWADAETKDLGLQFFVTDFLTWADTEAKDLGLQFSALDSLTWVDAQTKDLGLQFSATDTLTWLDSEALTQGELVSTTDSLTWVDVGAKALGLQFSVLDSLTWIDVEAKDLGLQFSATDVLTWQDAQAKLLSESVVLSDSLTWTDAEARDLGLQFSIADSLTWADTQEAFQTELAEIQDSLTWVDSGAVALAGEGGEIFASPSDVLTWADAEQTFQTETLELPADSLTWSDLAGEVVGLPFTPGNSLYGSVTKETAAQGNNGAGGASVAASGFSCSAKALVMVWVMSDGNHASNVTGVSGGGLTFAKKTENLASGLDVELWVARADTAITSQTLTASLGNSSEAVLIVQAYLGTAVKDGATALDAVGAVYAGGGV